MVSTKWGVIAISVLLLTVSGCTLNAPPATEEPLVTETPIPTGKPTITVNTPSDGDEVVLGNDILISATATDSVGVTSVQLFANEQLVKSISSEEDTGSTTLPVVLDYTPRTTGELNLRVVAYRSTTASDPVTFTVTVLDEAAPVPTLVDSGSLAPVIDPNDPTCRILPNVNLNYRTGPSTEYDRLGTLVAGTQVPIVGRIGDNSWWQVQVSSFTVGWVSAEFTTEYGNCLSVPVVPIPPTPTPNVPTATPTATPTVEAATAAPTLTPVPSATLRPPDLVITDISGETSIVLDGDGVTERYTVVITNTGDRPSTSFTNTIQVLPGGDPIELGVVSDLAPGQSIVLSASLTFDTAGEFTIQATADSEGVITEVSDVNNTASLVISVGAS
jgi:uncharacterized protein YraI